MQVFLSKQCNPNFDESFIRDTLALSSGKLARSTLTLNGRGEVFLRDDCSPNIIVRRYRRGGLFGKLIRHRYFRNPIHLFRKKPDLSLRMIREQELLDHLVTLDLPGPKPVAVAVDLHALTYEGYLLTEYISESHTLASLLLTKHLNIEIWQSIGSTIRRFHDKQVFHADLNATNILLDKNLQPYLIDFDKCSVKQGEIWKQANLDRLLRSLNKLSTAHAKLNFNHEVWLQLLKGYEISENPSSS